MQTFKNFPSLAFTRQFVREAGPAVLNVSITASGTPHTASYGERYTVIVSILGTSFEFSETFTHQLDEIELSEWMAMEIGKRLWMTLPDIDGETVN